MYVFAHMHMHMMIISLCICILCAFTCLCCCVERLNELTFFFMRASCPDVLPQTGKSPE